MCSNITNFTYNISGFSGDIDIIVIKNNDNHFNSSPFYVRFGKYKILNANEKIVSIYINNVLSKYKMKLGKSGEAHFIGLDVFIIDV